MDLFENKINVEPELLYDIFGSFDTNLRTLEDKLNVSIVSRDGLVKIKGKMKNVDNASKVLSSLVERAEKGESIEIEYLNYLIREVDEENYEQISRINDDFVARTVSGRIIKPKTLGQKQYVDLVREKIITLCTGPAGTGKTYLAMALAIESFKNADVNRIILTRPAIEAGEKLGFLPGDLQQKVDPYLRPLYDALHEIMGADTFAKNMEKGRIEVAPLAYMRGRTLDNSFIILDEAQNTTPEQMKMFLTRIGFGSRVIVTGDLTQVDLGSERSSGLRISKDILKNVDEIGQIELTNKDVVRHPLVQKIIIAYEEYEEKKSENKK